MVNVNKLKAMIIANGKTQKDVYAEMGLTKRQWQIRMEKRKFDSDDMYSLIKILKIEDPSPIFFAD